MDVPRDMPAPAVEPSEQTIFHSGSTHADYVDAYVRDLIRQKIVDACAEPPPDFSPRDVHIPAIANKAIYSSHRAPPQATVAVNRHLNHICALHKMHTHKSFRGYLICLTFGFLVSCATPFQPNVTTQYSADYYPSAALRLGEEARLLVEIHIGNNGKLLQEPTLRQTAESLRLNDGALKVARGMRFDVSGRTKPDPKQAYLVTIIFCMEPGHCDQFAPFPETKAVVVKAAPLPNNPQNYKMD